MFNLQYSNAPFNQNSQQNGFNSLFNPRGQQQDAFPGGGLPFGRSQSESAFRNKGQGNSFNTFGQNQSSNNFQSQLSDSKRGIHNNISSFISQNNTNFNETFKGKPAEDNPEKKTDPKTQPDNPAPQNTFGNNSQIHMQNTFGPQPNPSNFNQNNMNQSVPNALIGSDARPFGSFIGVNIEENKKEDIPEGEEQEESPKEEEHEPHCKFCPRKYNLSKMTCEECVSAKLQEQRKYFEQKTSQFQSKSKMDLDEIKRLRKQLSILEKDNKERQVQHEREVRQLKLKIQEEEIHGNDLLNTITNLNDIVRVNQNFKEECRLLTEENQDGWTKVYSWAEKFDIFTNHLLEKLPEKANEINKILIKEEENVLFSIQEKLSAIPKQIISILQKVQEDKKVELDCLKETEQQVVTVLESQKANFEKSNIPFPEITMTLALQPFKSSVSNLDVCIKDLEELKSQCVIFSIFKGEVCQPLQNEDISKSKYPLRKKRVEVESPKRSEAEVIQAAEPTIDNLDEGSNEDIKVSE